MRVLLYGYAAVVAVVAAAHAATSPPSIVVGNHVLAPNLSGQSVSLAVTGGNQVGGFDLNAEIADGGIANGGTMGPSFTFASGGAFAGANLIAGTIFANNNTGQLDLTTQKQVYSGSISTAGGTVSASGTVATLSFDTTGISPGIYSLKLAGFRNGAVSGNTDFGIDQNLQPIPANVTNGNLIVTYSGDANLDGSVGFDDLVILARDYGKSATFAQGDFNGDGTVGFDDLVILARNYGKSVNANPPPPAVTANLQAAVVPEPTCLGLLGVAVALLRRRRMR